MKRLITQTTICLSVVMVLTVYPVWADLTYEQTTTNEYVVGQGKKIDDVSHQKVYIKGKKVRLEDKKNNRIFLIRFDKETSYDLDTKSTTYTEKNFQALQTIQSQQLMQAQQVAPQRNAGMEAARKQLGKMGEGLSPERQGFMQQMMMRQQALMMGNAQKPETVSSDVEIKETNKTKKINGYPCRRVKIVQGKKKIIDMWLTTMAGPKNYFSEILNTLGLFKPEVIKAVTKLDGFPIKQKYKIQIGELAGTLQTVSVDNIQEGEVDSGLFSIPKGYKKVVPVDNSSDFEEEEEESF